MPVGNHRRHPEATSEDRVGSLAADPWHGEQFRHRVRHISTVALEKNPARRHQGSGLGSEKPDWAKKVFNVGWVGRGQRFWAWIPLQEFPRELLGHRIGALRREDDGDQEVERAVERDVGSSLVNPCQTLGGQSRPLPGAARG